VVVHFTADDVIDPFLGHSGVYFKQEYAFKTIICIYLVFV